MELIYVLLAYVVLINLYMFVLMGKDKRSARKGARRISERHFILWSALGGAIGAYAGMKHFRHKTKHLKFTLGIPLIIVIHIIIVVLGVYTKWIYA